MFALLNPGKFLWLVPALVGCGLLAARAQTPVSPSDGPTPGFNPFRPAYTVEQVEAWKKKYAFESIRERLKYEIPKSSDTAAQLAAESDEIRQELAGNIRAQSLHMLHNLKVQDFINQSGNGVSRRPPPAGGAFVDLPESMPVPELAKLPPLSEEEARFPATRVLSDEIVPVTRPFVEASWLPARREAVELNSYVVAYFLDPRTLGLVQSLDSVSGFTSHHFVRFPDLPYDTAPQTGPVDRERRWKLTRLELVSLLKHDTPCVYESEQLPSMEELSSKNAKTRPLDKFEANALQALRDGQHVQSSSTPNRVVMLGAIRATRQCRKCHEVPDGTMLGAFSYELRRDPPIKFEKPAANVQ